ncbi:Uncharacterised protein [Mycobacteroides abscessus subsp. abscessus]|nr:Uncharacterised protein [Mycobacteroides abscessus subsp. abscessus]
MRWGVVPSAVDLRGGVECVCNGVQIVREQMLVAVEGQPTADLCPSSFWTTLMLAPDLMVNEAYVWRRSCNRTPSHPSTAAGRAHSGPWGVGLMPANLVARNLDLGTWIPATESVTSC